MISNVKMNFTAKPLNTATKQAVESKNQEKQETSSTDLGLMPHSHLTFKSKRTIEQAPIENSNLRENFMEDLTSTNRDERIQTLRRFSQEIERSPQLAPTAQRMLREISDANNDRIQDLDQEESDLWENVRTRIDHLASKTYQTNIHNLINSNRNSDPPGPAGGSTPAA